MRKKWRMDPRFGLALLILANLIAFTRDYFWVEAGWIGVLILVTGISRGIRVGLKWMMAYFLLLCLQWYVLPVSPQLIATSFSIFANYARKMFPCLIVGSLLIRTVTIREFTVGLRKLHVPQKLIIPVSVTLRYFPAIREEAGYIRDAMRLRNIQGLAKVEAMAVPLIVSATATAEELSAAAVTRGIEDPAEKTSLVRLHSTWGDWILLGTAVAFLICGGVLF